MSGGGTFQQTRNFRLKTGVNDPRTKVAVPLKGSIPAAVVKTGTISVGAAGDKKAVRGTGTLFTTELNPGDYIYAGDVVREIDYIVNDLLLFIRDEFPATVSAADLYTSKRSQYKTVWVDNTGAADVTVQESTLKSDQREIFEAPQGVAPFSYDATGGELTFQIVE